MKRCAVLLPIGVLLAVAVVVLVPAQDVGVKVRKAPPAAAEPQRRERPLSVDVNVVLVNVTVSDPFNRVVTGLEREHFRVFEGDREQKVLYFSTEEVPVSLGVVFDCSGSMSDKNDMSRMAALQFFKEANPQDEFMLVDFNDRPRLISDFTTRVEEIQNRLVFIRTGGSTALFDALYLAINEMKLARHQRKAVLIISDGGENRSRYTFGETKELVRESDVQVYGIGIFGTPRSVEETEGPYVLNALAESSGGRAFSVGLRNAPDVARRIGLELRNEYVLGYRPDNEARDGKWRKITVKLVPPRGLPPLKVHARQGYYAPTQ
jgi:Ca-activated chloride channel family protein